MWYRFGDCESFDSIKRINMQLCNSIKDSIFFVNMNYVDGDFLSISISENPMTGFYPTK